MDMKLLGLLFLYNLGLSCFALEQGDVAKKAGTPRRVLVFGGNGFIGSEVVRRLLDHKEDVTIVNRGNWYFDSEKRIKPYIKTHYKCDRDKSLQLECKELLHSGKYDVVIDFSSYNAKQIQQAVGVLKDRAGVYIYISTDSVYEVCQKDHVAPTTEEDAVRPRSPKKRLELKKNEAYGHEKLACEEVLQEQRKAGGFPYVVLRLPDVIGPRDNSLRFWTYQLWLRVHEAIEHPVHLPSGVSKVQFSLVHVQDVANAVERVLDVGEQVHDQAFNLGFKEHLTLRTFLSDLADKLEVKDVQLHYDEETSWYTYPTVTKGPLNITKARTLLKWEPMTWKEALDSLCAFFDDAMTNDTFSEEKEMLIADFLEYTVPDTHYEAFLLKLKDIYGEAVLDGLSLDWGLDQGVPEIESAGNQTEGDANESPDSMEETGNEAADVEESEATENRENKKASEGIENKDKEDVFDKTQKEEKPEMKISDEL